VSFPFPSAATITGSLTPTITTTRWPSITPGQPISLAIFFRGHDIAKRSTNKVLGQGAARYATGGAGGR
jgi:hypothetical protein